MAEQLQIVRENLKRLRKEKGLSQQALADSISVHQSVYSRWESGESVPNLDSLERVCIGLGEPMVQLFRPTDLSKIPDYDKWELIQQLDPKNRETLMNMIDVFLLNHQRDREQQALDKKNERRAELERLAGKGGERDLER